VLQRFVVNETLREVECDGGAVAPADFEVDVPRAPAFEQADQVQQQPSADASAAGAGVNRQRVNPPGRVSSRMPAHQRRAPADDAPADDRRRRRRAGVVDESADLSPIEKLNPVGERGTLDGEDRVEIGGRDTPQRDARGRGSTQIFIFVARLVQLQALPRIADPAPRETFSSSKVKRRAVHR
jgi:hypothetical protein